MSQLLGQVISAGKMSKTVKVAVTSLKLHPVILKVIIIIMNYFSFDQFF